MAGKDIDPIRVRSALDVIKQNPGMRSWWGWGGVEPRFDGPALTMDVTEMSAVLEIDKVSRAARIQAGALDPAGILNPGVLVDL